MIASAKGDHNRHSTADQINHVQSAPRTSWRQKIAFSKIFIRIWTVARRCGGRRFAIRVHSASAVRQGLEDRSLDAGIRGTQVATPNSRIL
jgi:hypothetical protein